MPNQTFNDNEGRDAAPPFRNRPPSAYLERRISSHRRDNAEPESIAPVTEVREIAGNVITPLEPSPAMISAFREFLSRLSAPEDVPCQEILAVDAAPSAPLKESSSDLPRYRSNLADAVASDLGQGTHVAVAVQPTSSTLWTRLFGGNGSRQPTAHSPRLVTKKPNKDVPVVKKTVTLCLDKTQPPVRPGVTDQTHVSILPEGSTVSQAGALLAPAATSTLPWWKRWFSRKNASPKRRRPRLICGGGLLTLLVILALVVMVILLALGIVGGTMRTVVQDRVVLVPVLVNQTVNQTPTATSSPAPSPTPFLESYCLYSYEHNYRDVNQAGQGGWCDACLNDTATLAALPQPVVEFCALSALFTRSLRAYTWRTSQQSAFFQWYTHVLGWFASPNVCTWGSVTCGSDGTVTQLVLDTAYFVGGAGSEILYMRNLTYVAISPTNYNATFSNGVITADVFALPKLQWLVLGPTDLQLELPTAPLAVGSPLQWLLLDSMWNVAGAFPGGFFSESQLQYAQISNLSGLAATSLDTLLRPAGSPAGTPPAGPFVATLATLLMSNVPIGGPLPPYLLSFPLLTTLQLTSVPLTGSVPAQYKNLSPGRNFVFTSTDPSFVS